MARPSLLNKKICDIICAELREGCSLEGAAEAAGITGRTLHNWMRLGREAKSGNYFQFFHAIKKADAEGMKNLVREIRGASRKGNWQAAAWLLERKYPDVWGKRERIDVTKHGESDIGQLIIADKELSKLWTQTLKHVKVKRGVDESAGSGDLN